MRTDGVHCRESAGTGPVNLKVVPVTGAAFAGHHGKRLSFPTPTVAFFKISVAFSNLSGGHVESITASYTARTFNMPTTYQ